MPNKSKYYQNSKTGYYSKYGRLPLIKPEDSIDGFLFLISGIFKVFFEENNLDLRFYIIRSPTDIKKCYIQSNLLQLFKFRIFD